MERWAASQRAEAKSWVTALPALIAYPPGREPAQRRDPQELLSGCTVRELDLEVDTMPAELTELFFK